MSEAINFLAWLHSRESIKLIIAGSRTITDINIVYSAVEHFNLRDYIAEVVSGTANGVDKLGEKVAESFNIPIKQFPADWNKHGKSAGYIRNAEMAKYADALLAIWDGESKGTLHMIDLMKKEDKMTYLVNLAEIKLYSDVMENLRNLGNNA